MSSVGGKLCTSEASNHKEETCNVVIFGETGAGKSSLINLVAGTRTALTSCTAVGCTTETNVYDISIPSQNETLKVKLFDTVGLGKGFEGEVSDKDARRALKTLLRDLMKQTDIHLLMYCVRGARATKALYRNYNLIRSEVKERVPIVLVVTCLEDREPEMEDWWRDNVRSISDFGMTFAGHACVTTATIDRYAGDELERRHKQSYHAVSQLIEKCRSKGGQRPLSDAGERQHDTIRQVSPKMATSKNRHKTIVLFGETGAGKSSLVNLMAGKEVARTSPDTQRCTMPQWNEYTIDFDGDSYTVFETIGLDESQLEIKEYLESVENAYKLVRELDRRGGIDLLLFCVRAGKITTTLQGNYWLFHEFLCKKKVPIVLAVTNLEREQRMEDWWQRNEGTFDKYQIKVAGHACITAANRSDDRHKDLYEQSRITIRNLVQTFTADGQKQACMRGHSLLVSLMHKLKELLIGGLSVRRKDLVPHLTKRCGMSPEVAKQLIDMIE
ncbi:P-loop containing nucleoside triphosphate hydrolase protein [Suillus discolor]|uniref:P-loop containing nucleoside triphosphate hydrolase protein n=1 Tax=Suillus discolor TaxID=1912936 RepID=A0A9P7JX42_9AGAM|nr:P-loop containing nucleoside triphosphate hydrolase protein [Suillus discolor]KAG2113741.1 P-loop containing nucleoside triphosphate hydrolase protein [Suillus discolor]